MAKVILRMIGPGLALPLPELRELRSWSPEARSGATMFDRPPIRLQTTKSPLHSKGRTRFLAP
jgi:hypothetical protein